jgi:thiamine-phosphate pyrophosphorylase
LARAWRQQIAGFYSVLDSHDEELARLLVRPVADGGAGSRVLQVRIKQPGSPEPVAAVEILAAARMARKVTSEFGALLIVNDRLDIALAAGADGVHLGQDDLPLVRARDIVSRMNPASPFLIGVSTHNREQVIEAVRGGADYLGFGPIFATSTKDNPDPVQGTAGLREAVAAAQDVPIVAIGGITPDTAADVAMAGAAAACCISAVNHVENRALAGARISAALTRRATGSMDL